MNFEGPNLDYFDAGKPENDNEDSWWKIPCWAKCSFWLPIYAPQFARCMRRCKQDMHEGL